MRRNFHSTIDGRRALQQFSVKRLNIFRRVGEKLISKLAKDFSVQVADKANFHIQESYR